MRFLREKLDYSSVNYTLVWMPSAAGTIRRARPSLEQDPRSKLGEEAKMRVRVVLFFGAAFLLAGCRGRAPGIEPPRMCTLMGCLDTLTVSLDGEVPEEYTLQLTGSDGVPIEVSCTSGEGSETAQGQSVPCAGRSVTFNVAPAQVNLRLTWDGGALERNLTPAYETFQPNGPGCPPACRSGSVTIVVP
jgi:hypothetical protein